MWSVERFAVSMSVCVCVCLCMGGKLQLVMRGDGRHGSKLCLAVREGRCVWPGVHMVGMVAAGQAR